METLARILAGVFLKRNHVASKAWLGYVLLGWDRWIEGLGWVGWVGGLALSGGFVGSGLLVGWLGGVCGWE